MIVCVCHNISEDEIKTAIKTGSSNIHLLRENLGIGTCCGKCKSCTKKILREYYSSKEDKKSSPQIITFHHFAT